jgi:aspartate aminotransferase-like enzyme
MGVDVVLTASQKSNWCTRLALLMVSEKAMQVEK